MRGHYSTPAGAYRHIARAGDLATLVDQCMARAGLARTDLPAPGDIGVVDSPLGQMMAIKTGIGWAAKGPRGVVVGPYRMIAAWAVRPGSALD